MNQAGIDLLKHYEGFRDKAYLDLVGVPTIGYGFTKGVKLGDHMTQAEADARLKSELAVFERGLLMGGTPNQLAAMACLAYNIGLGAFAGSTVARRHLARDFHGAAEAFLLWDKARVAGAMVVVPGLVRRRHAERALYLTESA